MPRKFRNSHGAALNLRRSARLIAQTANRSSTPPPEPMGGREESPVVNIESPEVKVESPRTSEQFTPDRQPLAPKPIAPHRLTSRVALHRAGSRARVTSAGSPIGLRHPFATSLNQPRRVLSYSEECAGHDVARAVRSAPVQGSGYTPHYKFSRQGNAPGAPFSFGPAYHPTSRVMRQLMHRTVPTDPNYRPDLTDSCGLTDGHYIRVNRLQEDICTGKVSGRWLRNERLAYLLRDYESGKTAKRSPEMLVHLDHILMDDDRNFSCGSPLPWQCPLGLTYGVDERGLPIETTDWDALEAQEV